MPTMYAVCINNGKADITTVDVIGKNQRFYITVHDGLVLKSSSFGRRLKPTIPGAKKYFRQKQRREIAKEKLIIWHAQKQIDQMQGWINDLDPQPPKG